MAKPRVFISSTYYDLRAIRADLERYIREHGFEPVLNERGHVPFHAEKRLKDACYKEIELSDILVSIIGGRYGTESREEPYSRSFCGGHPLEGFCQAKKTLYSKKSQIFCIIK